MDAAPRLQKKRIRVACNNCRRKKIKCDGANPCAHCVASKELCVYAERPPSSPKRVRIKKESVPIDVPALSSASSASPPLLLRKVDALERRLGSVDAKIDSLLALLGKAKLIQSDAYSETDSSLDENVTTPAKQTSGAAKKSAFGENAAAYRPAIGEANHEKYFGAHSVFCIFSENSLNWMGRLLSAMPEGPDAVTAIRNFPLTWLLRNKPLLLKWIDPPLVTPAGKYRLLMRPFAPDRQYTMGIIEKHFPNRHFLCHLCPKEYALSLFDTYYSTVEGKIKIKLKVLELLIMTTLLLLAICCKANAGRRPYQASPGGPGSSQETLLSDSEQKQFTEYTDNAIFYYHRISVISEGCESIQGILMLMSFIDANWLGAPFSYTLALQAIRHAQDMGLHRFDSYLSMNPEEFNKRRIIWWYCQFFDVETCYRFGKPPLINVADALGGEQHMFIPSEMVPDKPSFNSPNDDFSQLAGVIWRITCIRSKLYHLLFVASSENESYRKMAITLDKLNSEMFAVADSMDSDDRPRFFKDNQFAVSTQVVDRRRSQILYLHFVYFFHLLVINRLPSLVGPPEPGADCEDAIKYRNLSHDAARTILILAKLISRKNCDVVLFNWLLFFILTAYLHILGSVLNFPDHPETKQDIFLLIDSLMNFFAAPENHRCDFVSDNRHPSSKNAIVSLLACAVLRACIIYYEAKTGEQIVAQVPGLAEHLKTPREAYPELYIPRDSLTNNANAKPDTPSEAPTIRASSVYPMMTSRSALSSPVSIANIALPPRPMSLSFSPSNGGGTVGTPLAPFSPGFAKFHNSRSPSLNMGPPLPSMPPCYTDPLQNTYAYSPSIPIPPMEDLNFQQFPPLLNDQQLSNMFFPHSNSLANFFFDNSMP